MQWITLGQYFYKLYSAVLLILLVPIFAFIFIYWRLIDAEAPAVIFKNATPLFIIPLLSWLIIFFSCNKKIKSIRKDQGLRLKLEKYFTLTIVRYILGVVGCLALAYGFYLTRDNRFTGLFA